ncbi:MAG: response regulator, partial [Vicinamibacterales bacterium]
VCSSDLVDDNPDSALSMAMMLSMMGHDTRTAHDGEEALTTAEAFRPRVVLLDIGLPKLNGYEVAQRIREQDWGTSMFLVAITGWGQDEDRRRSEDVGMNLHMVKPVEPGALDRVLADL